MNQLKPNQMQQVIQSLNSLPLYFIENKGQVNECVKFHIKILHGNVYFTSEEIVYQFLHRIDERKTEEERLIQKKKKKSNEIKADNIRVKFIGANERVKVEGLEESEAKVSYFQGNDPQKWVRGARTYEKLLYRELYPHIDLMVYGGSGRIKHEYLVRVGGEVKEIKLKYEGVERLSINEKGQLEVETSRGVLREDVPLSYQVIEGQRVEVETEYVINKDNTIRFKVGEYRKDKELIIDPSLEYSTYLGGSNTEGSIRIAIDGSGNAYITGLTDSSDFPTTNGAYDTSLDGDLDAFITKINFTGTDLVYSTYLGGNNGEYGYGIAVDGSGNAYVTGGTASSDFPTTSDAYDLSLDGDLDAFITKINSTGADLIYSTYLGGSNTEGSKGIAIDGSGNAYVTGSTYSSDFPTTPGAYDTSLNGYKDAFITKLKIPLPQGSIFGKVTDKKTGNSIAKAKVKIVKKTKKRVKKSTRTDINGDYIISNIEYGTYKMRVKKKGYKPYKKNKVKIDGDVVFDVKLKKK